MAWFWLECCLGLPVKAAGVHCRQQTHPVMIRRRWPVPDGHSPTAKRQRMGRSATRGSGPRAQRVARRSTKVSEPRTSGCAGPPLHECTGAEGTRFRLAPRGREAGPPPIDATAPGATCGCATNPRQARRGATRAALLRSRPITGRAAAPASACACLAPPRLVSRAHTRQWGAERRVAAAAVFAGHRFPAACGGACGGHREPWRQAAQPPTRPSGRRRHGRGQAVPPAGCEFVAKPRIGGTRLLGKVFGGTPRTGRGHPNRRPPPSRSVPPLSAAAPWSGVHPLT